MFARRGGKSWVRQSARARFRSIQARGNTTRSPQASDRKLRQRYQVAEFGLRPRSRAKLFPKRGCRRCRATTGGAQMGFPNALKPFGRCRRMVGAISRRLRTVFGNAGGVGAVVVGMVPPCISTC